MQKKVTIKASILYFSPYRRLLPYEFASFFIQIPSGRVLHLFSNWIASQANKNVVRFRFLHFINRWKSSRNLYEMIRIRGLLISDVIRLSHCCNLSTCFWKYKANFVQPFSRHSCLWFIYCVRCFRNGDQCLSFISIFFLPLITASPTACNLIV